jgi:hypothetical protein
MKFLIKILDFFAPRELEWTCKDGVSRKLSEMSLDDLEHAAKFLESGFMYPHIDFFPKSVFDTTFCGNHIYMQIMRQIRFKRGF